MILVNTDVDQNDAVLSFKMDLMFNTSKKSYLITVNLQSGSNIQLVIKIQHGT